MLPTSHYGRHGGKRGGGAALPVLVASLVLAAICALGYYSSHSKASNLQKELKSLQGSHNHVEEQLNHQRSIYQHMEHEYHTCQRKINDMTREVQQKDHVLQMRTQEKESCFASESQLQEVIKQLQEQITYEKAIVEAHIGKVAQLEQAHNSRENDWQALSKTWAKFEADATKENTRLLVELAKATQAAGGAAPAATPPVVPQPLPEQIPKTRPESAFDSHVIIPKEEDYVHHLKRAEEYLKAQQQKLQHPGGAQPETHHVDPSPDHSAGLHGAERRLATDGLDKDPHGSAGAGLDGHAAPSPYSHMHHDHLYEDNPNHWVDDTPEHLDPLDHYWVHDQPWDNDHAHWDHNAHHTDSSTHHHDAYHVPDPAHHSPPAAHNSPPPAHHDPYHMGGHDMHGSQHQYDSGGHATQRQAQEHHTMQDWQVGGSQQQHRQAPPQQQQQHHSQQDWQAHGAGSGQQAQHDWQTQQAQRDWDAHHAARQAQQAGHQGQQHDDRQQAQHGGSRNAHPGAGVNPNLLPRHGHA